MKLGLCIVGCGGYADTVMTDIHAVQEMRREFDFYFASRDPRKARDYCERFGGADYFGDYQEALADPRVEAAYFFTPHDVHLENAELAARHSKRILVEKPIARTLPEAQALIQAARDAGVTLMVAENYRFLQTALRCKSMIERGNIGDLRLINIRAEGYRVPAAWRNDSALTGGGSFIDGGIHFVDIMLHLGGFPERIYAAYPPKVHRDSEGEDGIVMMADLPGGCVGVINFSRATSLRRQRVSVEVSGSHGYIEFEPYGGAIEYEDTKVRRTVRLPSAGRGLREMLLEFKSAIRDGRQPLMSGEEAARDLAIVLAAYQSANERKHIALSDPYPPA